MTVVWTMAHIQSSALFASLQPVLAGVAWPSRAWPTLGDYQALLDKLSPPVLTGSGAQLRIAPHAAAKPDDWRQAYEPRLYLTGELQTRIESWHDVFNLFVWATFPQTKAGLNARHFMLQQMRAEAGRSAAPRDAAQDALTQFDETGVIVISSDAGLLKLVENFAWKELFWARREQTRARMRCLLFGHGLMEKALTPYVGMTGKAMLLHVPDAVMEVPQGELIARVDSLLAQHIAVGTGLDSPRMLAPFPVLGFPGIWPDQQTESFYDNQYYFRSGRSASATM